MSTATIDVTLDQERVLLSGNGAEDRNFLGAFLAFKPRHGGDYSGVGRIASKSLAKGKEAEEQQGYSFLTMDGS